MTLADLRAVVARVSLEHAAIPTTLDVIESDIGPDDQPVQLLVVALETRDPWTGGDIRLAHRFPLGAGWDAARVLEHTLRVVRAVWLHELDEVLRVDGELVRDPHGCWPGSRVAIARPLYDMAAPGPLVEDTWEA